MRGKAREREKGERVTETTYGGSTCGVNFSAQTTKTHTARNRSRKKVFASLYKADFLPKRSVARDQRGAYLS